MKGKIRFIITTIFLIFLHNHSNAQNLFNIKGTIVDDNNEGISYVSVIINEKGKTLSGTLTDDNGNFSFKAKCQPGNYTLVIEFIGYAKKEIEIKLSGSALNLGNIILKEDAIQLQSAIISTKTDITRSSVEHTVINASANMSADKGTALDLLRTSSSVNIINDAISIRGNTNILVLIDGVPTTVTDLSAIPAANIKSIDIVTNPDASYDAGGTGGVINIKSNKTSIKGFSGMISANYGFNHFVTGNIALSYAKPTSSWRFSYNTRYEDDIIQTTLQRHLHSNGNQTFQEMTATKYTYNNNISLGSDFKINSRNSISLDAKCILPRNNLRQDLYNNFIKSESKSSETRHNDVTWNRENIEGIITYKHIITPEISDIIIKGSISKIWGHRPSHYYLEGIEVNRSNSGGSPFISSIQADFRHKFKGGTLSAGAKLTYRSNDIYHQFYKWSGENWEYSAAFSNDLLHTETIPAAYVMFTSKIGKRFSYKAGFRGEYSIVTLQSNHENLNKTNGDFFASPSISGSYHIDDRQNLSFAFSRRIGRPAYPQLNPYMSMVDATTFEQGNMNLKPEKSSKVDLSYNFKSRHINIFADAYLNYTTDYISQITSISDDLLVTTYINGNKDLRSGIDVSLKVKPLKWLNATLSANTYYVQTKAIHDYAETDNSGISNNSNILFDFLAGKSTDIQVQYFLNTPQYYPQLTTSLTHFMNIGLKQRFMKGALTGSILLTDVFNTYKWQVQSNNRHFDLKNTSTRKSRMLWIGISYNFNSFKQKKQQSKSDNDRSLIKLGL